MALDMDKEVSPRNQDIIGRFAAGEPLGDIAAIYNITEAHVLFIAIKHGGYRFHGPPTADKCEYTFAQNAADEARRAFYDESYRIARDRPEAYRIMEDIWCDGPNARNVGRLRAKFPDDGEKLHNLALLAHAASERLEKVEKAFWKKWRKKERNNETPDEKRARLEVARLNREAAHERRVRADDARKKRDSDIIRRYKSGELLQDIAARFHITSERVRYIAREKGLPPRRILKSS